MPLGMFCQHALLFADDICAYHNLIAPAACRLSAYDKGVRWTDATLVAAKAHKGTFCFTENLFVEEKTEKTLRKEG
jgi:hypothetical protein